MPPQLPSPPRKLPLFSRLIILFGGFYSQFGWLFFGFGMIFFWIFFMNSQAAQWISSLSKEIAPGVVVRVDTLDKGNDEVPLIEHIIDYQVEGNGYQEKIYRYQQEFEVGQELSIAYSPKEPSKGKLIKEATFGWIGSVVVIFPLAGLLLIIFAIRQNQKAIDLLVHGRMAEGTFVEKVETGTRINDFPVYRYTYRFTASDGLRYTVQGSTHVRYLLEEGHTEQLLFLPQDPNYAFLFDLIPNAPGIRPDGRYSIGNPFRAVTLVVPFLSIILHGGIAYIWWWLGNVL